MHLRPELIIILTTATFSFGFPQYSSFIMSRPKNEIAINDIIPYIQTVLHESKAEGNATCTNTHNYPLKYFNNITWQNLSDNVTYTAKDFSYHLASVDNTLCCLNQRIKKCGISWKCEATTILIKKYHCLLKAIQFETYRMNEKVAMSKKECCCPTIISAADLIDERCSIRHSFEKLLPLWEKIIEQSKDDFEPIPKINSLTKCDNNQIMVSSVECH